ncbi:uncharacterized protein LOC143458809 [Clavelina lepadiformis]|uniref:uncharacterized protein LOC143458809 n=1 Tax=Clavelina lepadiformis TaxID=159417 RepID=UPI0040423A2C
MTLLFIHHKWGTLWIIFFIFIRFTFSGDVDDTMHIPPEYTNCSCEWSGWMDADTTIDDDTQDETLPALRRSGYKFCAKPVDIQCYNYASQKVIANPAFGTCSVDIGFSCQVFCDDYKVRVACCYCPPKAVGPEFQIESQSNQGCLKTQFTSNLSSTHSLRVDSNCLGDDLSQLWTWVSTNQIMNKATQQCIATDETTSGSAVITKNCDDTDAKQRLVYDKYTKTLTSTDGYISSTDGRFTFYPRQSKFMAKLPLGTTDMTTMQGFPCDDELTDPEFGSVDCSFGAYQGSECHFSCDHGYKLAADAQDTSICLRNRQFSAPSPTCEKIVCNPPLTSHENGEVQCTNSNGLDSNCIFKCDTGYALETGYKQSICLENGNWDPYPPPKCNQIICPKLAEVTNGNVNCSQSNIYGSKCIFSCSEGYERIGAKAVACVGSGTWNDTKPICQKIQCPALNTLANGKTTCSAGQYYMSSCRYACDEGYTMVGSGSTLCNADGTWSSTPPTCERKTCNKLVTPDHGSLSCSDGKFYSSKCQFGCNPGYRIEGESSLTCTAEGWNHGSPECIRITCSHLLSPVNGQVSCSDEDFFGSKCTFSCQIGYEVEGSKVVQCGERGWNDSSPTCPRVHCPMFTKPRHGQVTCYPAPGNEYGNACFFTCDEGYTKSIPNSPPVVCSASGTWSGPEQTCKRIQCRRLTSLRKGTVTCSDGNNYKSNCTFKCNKGFNHYGATETTCGVNGWDAEKPTCDRLVCNPRLNAPENGQISCTTKGLLTCSFTCNKGFQLTGNDMSECQSDETWSVSEIPVCEKISCPKAVGPNHGSVKCTDKNLFNSECNYTCDRGFTRVGDQLSHCTDDGTWDNKAPTCTRISCHDLSPPTNGLIDCADDSFYGSTCSFSCDEGYALIGAKSAICQLNSTWSKRLPYCERITCSPGFSNPSNGRVICSDFNNYASVCNFQCDEGFTLQGAPKTECDVSGWTVTKAPSCKKITCPKEADALVAGTESCDGSNDYQTLCEYECNRGYELIGASSRTCQRDGRWTDSRPTCQKIECPVIRELVNGQTVCQSGNEYLSVCVFVCGDNYNRVGTSKATCKEDKTWSPALFPKCELIPTTTPPTTTTNATATTKRTTKSTTTSSTTTMTSTTSTTATPPTNVIGITPVSVNTKPPFIPTEKPNSSGNRDDAQKTPTPTSTPGTGENPASAGIPIIPIAVSIVGVVLIVVIIVLCIVWRRRNNKQSFSKGIPMTEHRYDESQLQKLIPNGSTNRRFPAVPLDRLESEFTRKHADDDKLFREEFSGLPEGHGTRENGGKAMNKEKNRYTNVIPYDHSRVVLPKANGTDNDYINASFIDGYKHKGKFIAAQGPKECTVDDFWRMIWDQNVTTIIMVTKLNEGKESKCALYWPQSGSQLYNDLNVVFIGENHLVDYTVRKFTIQQVRGDATLSMRRNLMQYHFTSWPDFGVPKTPSGMLKFLRKIKHGSPTGYGAIVVHCSAGVGRTGTFICVDAMVDMMLRENKVDVYGFVSQMRSQRPEMVQTEQQYIFIYQALLEHHLYGDTEVEATEVSAHIDELNQRMPGNVTGMEHEFKKLTTIRIQKEQMRAGNHPANMRKNRVLLILPYDWNRVILPIKRGVENTDYINASYIDGYRQKDAYIATQGPLPHTVEDFWRLIWESKSASIVMLTELVERGQAKCEQYWPDDGAMIYGDLQVEHISENELDNYTTRDFVVTSTGDQNDRKHLVRQFHYHGWPETGPPVSGFSMIELVEQVQKQQQTSGNHPITIHCSAGAGRTGAFCALSTALEQVKAEGVLDMFQIVKCLRMQRPHMVQNLEQYEFCYRAVQEYIDSMSEYYNFK